jgi:hypothetical protein
MSPLASFFVVVVFPPLAFAFGMAIPCLDKYFSMCYFFGGGEDPRSGRRAFT